MANIFKERQEYAEGVNRSSFDLSHRNNFTTRIGQITPIFLQECVPGDSVQIKTDLGLRFAPLVFPIQTPMVATVNYFKVPHRILWENFEDFIQENREGIVHPYIAQDYMWHSTGSLADYLGIPSTYASPDHESRVPILLEGSRRVTRQNPSGYNIQGVSETVQSTEEDVVTFNGVENLTVSVGEVGAVETYIAPFAFITDYWDTPPATNAGRYFQDPTGNIVRPHKYAYVTSLLPELLHNEFDVETNNWSTNRVYGYFMYADVLQNPSIFDPSEWTIKTDYNFTASQSGSDVEFLPVQVQTDQRDFLTVYNELRELHPNIRLVLYATSDRISPDGSSNIGSTIVTRVIANALSDVSSLDSPFVIQEGEEFPAIRINALPFRAMEAIYNWHYRTNTQVDPFILDGHPEYNKWITNPHDGADSSTPLTHYFRNYELDFLTSAVNSPQQGEAPLVGVSSTGTFTFEDENGVQYTAKAIVTDDGKLTGIDTYDENLPQASLHRLIDTISHGISINDFRNVNAFQRWKEKNIRRGYRYVDGIKSHFGVDNKSIKYNDPEYLGGFSRNVGVQQITSSTSTSEINLGDYGGQATLFANSDHSITTYCDEHCFVIGVLTITPIPVYSQLLDPTWTKSNIFSYQWPEFNHLGYQPIAMKHVTPIESYVTGKTSGEDELNKTFGYQRPYWDMVSRVDTSHGHMRTDMSDYLMTRYFQTPPELGHDFLVVNPEDLTNPFVDTDANADNIVGQAYFEVHAQRPVSRMAIPRIEP